jgi:hypothetical protein
MKRLLLSCLTWPVAACTGSPPPSEPVALEADEKVLFTCMLEVGAPHKRIDVLEILLSAEEQAAAKEAEQDAAEESSTEPDTTTLEKNVRLAVNEVEPNVEGQCFRRNEGGKYVCRSFSGDLMLEWPGEAPKEHEPQGPAKVRVKEKWLFGTKKYWGNCTRKM